MAGGVGINFGVPGAEGQVGGGVNYFFNPTPGDVKGVGIEIDIGGSASVPDPLDIAGGKVQFGIGQCFTPMCIQTDGKSCSEGSYGIMNGYPWNNSARPPPKRPNGPPDRRLGDCALALSLTPPRFLTPPPLHHRRPAPALDNTAIDALRCRTRRDADRARDEDRLGPGHDEQHHAGGVRPRAFLGGGGARVHEAHAP